MHFPFGVFVFYLSLFIVFSSLFHFLFFLLSVDIGKKNYHLYVPLTGNISNSSSLEKYTFEGHYLYLFPASIVSIFTLFWILINNPDLHPPLGAISFQSRSASKQRNYSKQFLLFFKAWALGILFLSQYLSLNYSHAVLPYWSSDALLILFATIPAYVFAHLTC